MSLIEITNLTFGYEGSLENIFENVSLKLDTNWRCGLIGRNGRGKTTLLRLLMGELPHGGAVRAGVEFEYFPCPVENPGDTALGVARSLAPEAQLWELEREISLLSLPEELLSRPFDTLSGGERTRLLLAALFLGEGRFPLIDEPTNHLDGEGRRLVGEYLRGKPGFILVSHDRQLLDDCVDHVLSINRADIELQRGNFTSWEENKRRQDEREEQENDRLRQDIRRLSESARRAAGWSDSLEKTKKGQGVHSESGLRPDRGYIGHKAQKLMKRAKTIESRKTRAAEEKSKLLKNIDTAEALSIVTLPHPKKTLISARDLSLSFGDRKIFDSLSFGLRAGDRVELRGPNGSGKTSLLRLAVGDCLPHGGSFEMPGGLTVSYVPQDTSGLRGGLREFAGERELPEPLFLAILRKLSLPREQFSKDLSELSEGQCKKVLLAASLSRPAHLFVWDEPLNYVDVLSRIQLEDMLLRCSPTLLFVEHDGVFSRRIATKTVEIL